MKYTGIGIYSHWQGQRKISTLIADEYKTNIFYTYV